MIATNVVENAALRGPRRGPRSLHATHPAELPCSVVLGPVVLGPVVLCPVLLCAVLLVALGWRA